MKKANTSKSVVKIENLDQANDGLRRIGELECLIADQEIAFAEVMLAAKAKLDASIKEWQEERKVLTSRIKSFANKKRGQLTGNGSKTIQLSSGEFGWRTSPAHVKLTDDEEKVLETLTEMNLSQYIRVIRELDREALLRDRPTVSGVTFGQKENFFLKAKESIPVGERQVD